MKTITLPAIRNGNHVDPVEPYSIPDNARLFIVVATPENEQESDADFRADWQALGAAGLARAYGEKEPDYPDSLIREPNPEYGKR
ncbi:MAG: hypothetical protein HC901_00725 [Bdellovibrionaceae bacterium]|nr:hypothetical protein [Pseudobdellovibrionaceae bacterium]